MSVALQKDAEPPKKRLPFKPLDLSAPTPKIFKYMRLHEREAKARTEAAAAKAVFNVQSSKLDISKDDGNGETEQAQRASQKPPAENTY